jgi:FlaA1/EpsC-like NDP-sugar epimerase
MKVIPDDLRQKRTIIIGAGVAGAIVLEEIRSTLANEIQVVGFVDDDLAKQNTDVMGVKVLGDTFHLKEIMLGYDPEVAIIAIPSASGEAVERISNELSGYNIDVRIIPGMFESIRNNAVIGSPIRIIGYNDIFNRRPSEIDIDGIMTAIKGKNVLVTGGAGSIGSEIVRTLLELNAESIYVLDNSENNMMDLLVRLENHDQRKAIHPIIADITDDGRMAEVFSELDIDIVYHAAARKHVVFMEMFPHEAVKTNVLGTYSLLELCRRHGIERFVMISTDKAVNPTSVMGASKRICELLVSEFDSRYGLSYCSVRFGNVFGSAGSVIPIFKQQIEGGGPVTVTHPDVKRFFMTITEAARLVVQASVFDHGDQIYVLDMKEQIPIIEIAKKMIKLYHAEGMVDIRITGLKPGEKVSEELYHGFERRRTTSNPSILSVSSDTRWKRMPDDIEWLKMNNNGLVGKMVEIIPQFHPSSVHVKRG